MKPLFYIACLLLFLSGCSSSQRLTRQEGNNAKEIIRTARKYTGTRYVYGGSTPKGFDCSGFVQYVYRQNGYTLPRTSAEQSNAGKKVDRKDLKPGDLVFFKGSNKRSKKVGHVGIVTGSSRGEFDFIHAGTSTGVRVDSSDNTYYKLRYIKARRVLGK